MSEHSTAKTVKTTIDGREVEVARDRWALDVAREMGIAIPTLCAHPALEPYGACRLCVVEVKQGRWTWLTTSCDLPIREGMSIRTVTPEVLKARRLALELLWAEAPQAEEVAELARQLGVERPRFAARSDDNRCILCGLCVRVCEKILGDSAISFSRRGARRQVGPPFEDPSAACIGCGACASVCPTGHIVLAESQGKRTLSTWKTEVEMVACPRCGRQFATAKALEHLRGALPEHMEAADACPACRRKGTAAILAQKKKTPSPGPAAALAARAGDSRK